MSCAYEDKEMAHEYIFVHYKMKFQKESKGKETTIFGYMLILVNRVIGDH